ncbi:putative Pre-mRNA-splicing factor 18 [Paratrimastix pyriformis]|uniref:Pre-mRNA-splicing factor 18 n=1 Tax=Paratrimastix pyriformis TaxID=342808 RepID=A0ABQ8UR24_9EUKA|nr:putative Pre-mRNA-splicing factor 18 [Paratrimastix pyriformis]
MMDPLAKIKEEIAKRRQAESAAGGARKWRRRGEIEKEEAERRQREYDEKMKSHHKPTQAATLFGERPSAEATKPPASDSQLPPSPPTKEPSSPSSTPPSSPPSQPSPPPPAQAEPKAQKKEAEDALDRIAGDIGDAGFEDEENAGLDPVAAEKEEVGMTPQSPASTSPPPPSVRPSPHLHASSPSYVRHASGSTHTPPSPCMPFFPCWWWDQVGEDGLQLPPRQDVFRMLRRYGEPITLFGETDLPRVKRLRLAQLRHDLQHGQQDVWSKLEKSGGSALGGSGYNFTYMQEFLQSVLSGSAANTAAATASAPAPDPHSFSVAAMIDEEDASPSAAKPATKGHEKEEFLLSEITKYLKTWEADLEARPESVKKTAAGRKALNLLRQCAEYIKPLFSMLRRRQCPQEILDPLYRIFQLLEQREYVKASDVYLRFSIGNSPWPMGVTCVGIHERSAREKIHSDQIAHVLNDESQRKYIQSIKRIMTFAQERYPTDPSKSVGWR